MRVMAGEAKEEGKGFRFEDRRRVSSQSGEAGKNAAEGASAGQSAEERREARSGASLPEITFSAFVISLSTQALVHLGEIPNPLSGKTEGDTDAAKQTIDILAMLREKTRGNLDQSEEKLMDDILYDLRMRFVEAVRKK